MIVFLTLIYCALLFLLIKLKVIRLTIWWKISPALWMVFLLIVLFIPMQWGAPSGTVNVYEFVVEIVPNVSGEVTDVSINGLQPIQKGDTLFKIDPVPYQAEVDRLESELEAARQTVLQLESASEAADARVVKVMDEIEVAKSEQKASVSAIDAAKAAVEEAKAGEVKSTSVVRDLQVQFDFARSERDRIAKLEESGVATESQLQQAEIRLTGLETQLNAAKAEVTVSEQKTVRSKADAATAEANSTTADLKLKQLIDADLPQAQALAREAKLAATSRIGDEYTIVASIQAQLDRARYDLEQTDVQAPSDGYVIGATLLPGQRVSNLPVRSWMAFVDTRQSKLAVGIHQNMIRHVRPGQDAEIVFKLRPGRTFAAKVESIAYISPSGQLKPAGDVPDAPSPSQSAKPFGVILSIDEELPALNGGALPGGAVGSAAIYTDSSKATHVIRRVMLRMESWMNYIKP